jgi:alkylation response protein AidB-like acyl-CoA dehydrogenase
VIEKDRGSFPDGLRGEPIDKVGYHGMTTFHLWFDGLRVPEANRLGSGGGGGDRSAFAVTQSGLNVARVHTAARAIGLARGALEDSVAYSAERVQFEQPIASFQAIRFKIADMAAEIEAARALTWQVAQAMDDGHNVEKEAAMAKLVATEMAVRVTGDGIQIHGGNGYTTERQVERYWRDARLTTIFEGTSEIQRRTISDRILGRVA